MASKVSSLIVRLTDDVSGPAAKAAGALRGLAGAGDGLSRLKSAAAGLDQLGAKMRQARTETEKAAKELAAAEKRMAFFRRSKEAGSHNYPMFEASGEVAAAEARLKAAKRAHAAAERQMAATRGLLVEQKRAVAALSAGMSGASAGIVSLKVAEAGLAGAATHANAALAKQPALMAAAASKAAGLTRTYRDLAAGMGEAGRKQIAQIEASRRMVAGMSAPARAATEAAEAHRRVLAQVEAERAATRRGAIATVGAGAGIIAAHRGKEIGLQAVSAAASMDYAVRYQQVATDVREEDQKRLLLPQAKRIGQETKFSNEDIVHAQTGAMQGLPFKDPKVKAEVGAALVEQARHWAVILQSNMTDASEGMRSFLQNTNKDISTPAKAFAEAQRGTNLMVKMAKLGGMSAEDVQQFVKFGFPTGTQAGLSDTTLAALGAGGRRAGLRGDELGVFTRAVASKLVAPTVKGLDSLTAAGIDYNKFTTMPGGLSTDNLEAFSKRRFGKGFSESQRTRLNDLLEDSEVVADRDDFTKQVSAIVSESFGKSKGGKTKAQDAQKIAKMVGDFHKLSIESVDTEGLLRAIFSNPKMTAALRNAFFTDKHGGKAGMISSKMGQFNEDVDSLKEVGNDPKFAEKKSQYMTQGLGGSIDNLKGSFETMVLNIGTANEGLIRFAADGLAQGNEAFSNLSQTSQQVLSLIAGGAAVAGGVWGTATLMKNLLGFGASATALTGSAASLSASAAALNAAAVALGGKGVVPEVVRTAAPAATAAAGLTAGAIAGAVATGVGTAALVYAAGGRYQPEEVVRMRDELSGLNKTLERQNESVYRKQSQDQDASAETARRDKTLARIADLTAALERAATAQPRPESPAATPSEAAREALEARKAGASSAPTAAAPRAPVTTPAPPVRPPDLGGVTDAAAKTGTDAGQAIADGIRAQAPEAAQAGATAGVSAGKGVAQGIEQASPEAVEKGRTLFERLKSLFGAGINVPINLQVEGGAASVHKASWVSLPAVTRASFVRAAARASGGGVLALRPVSRTAPSAEPGPGPAVSPQAAFGDGVDVARLPAGMRNNNPGNIKYVGQRNALGPSRNTDQGDPQAVYASPEDGMRALVDLARRKWQGGRQTVSDLVARSGGWTPGNHGAAANIARSAGVGVHDRIDLSDEDTMRRFVRGLITQEHGPASRLYSDDLIRRAIRPRETAPAQEAAARPERPAIPGMMPGAERVNPGYGKPLHQGGTGLSRYSDDDLAAMQARQDALERARAQTPAPERPAAPPRAVLAPGAVSPEAVAAALARIQARYPAPATAPVRTVPAIPAAPPAPTAVPGLSRPAPGTTPSGVPAIAPQASTGGLDGLGAAASRVQAQLAALSAVSVAPQVSAGGLDALIAKANAAAAALSRVAALAGSANAAIAGVNASAGSGGGGSSGGSGGGGSAPASTGMVRRGLANNFA